MGAWWEDVLALATSENLTNHIRKVRNPHQTWVCGSDQRQEGRHRNDSESGNPLIAFWKALGATLTRFVTLNALREMAAPNRWVTPRPRYFE